MVGVGKKRPFKENGPKGGAAAKVKTGAPPPEAVVPTEEYFPRGGSSNPGEGRPSKKPKVDGYEPDMFAKGGKKGGKKGQAGLEDFVAALASSKNQAKYVELLKYKSLSVGMRLWGCVSEITPHHLIIALPHGIRGAAKAADCTEAATSGSSEDVPALTEVYQLGQLVRCVVTGMSGGGDRDAGDDASSSSHKRLSLSLRPAAVNSGVSAAALQPGMSLICAVRSVEDHGLLLTTGIGKLSGFLPRGAMSVTPAAPPPREGQLIECHVESVDRKKGIVTVKYDPEGAAAREASAEEATSLEGLMPGALVTAKIKEVLQDGLQVEFLQFFSGTIDVFHLPSALPKGGLEDKYKVGSKVKARLLYIDPSTKRVGLTLQESLVSGHIRTDFAPLGAVVDQATVRRVDPALGLLLELPPLTPGGPCPGGFCHISNVSDTRVEKLDKLYKPGSNVACRIIGYRPMDGLASVSCKPSVLQQEVFSYAELLPGLRISGTLTHIGENGATIELAPGLKAAVTAPHMHDLGPKQALKKLKVGQRVAGRVLDCTPAARHCHLTLRKQLVESKLAILSDISLAEPGTKAHGIVTGVQDYGVFVAFFGGVKGLVKSSELGLSEGQRPADAYEAGQIVRCRVVSVESGKGGVRQLKLSMVAEKEGGGGGAAAAADPLSAYPEGTVIGDAVATEVGESSNSFVVRVGGEDSHVHGILDRAHLSDHPAGAAALAAALRVGDTLTGLLVLSKDASRGMLRLSRKRTLITAAASSSLPSDIGQLKEGEHLPGYIVSVTSDAAFVRFLGALTGRAGLPQLADIFVADAAKLFSVGDSVRAQVAQIDAPRRRFAVTLKPSVCASPDAAFLDTLLGDLELAAELAASHEGSSGAAPLPWATALKIGAVASGSVAALKDYGTIVDLDAVPDAVGIALPSQLPESGAAPAEGTKVTARILDVNKADGIVQLSLRSDMVAGAAGPSAKPGKKDKKDKASSSAAAPAPEEGSSVEARVEAHMDEYVIASLPGTPRVPAFFSAKDFNQRVLDAAARFPVGATVAATVHRAASEENGWRTVLHVPLAGRDAKKRPEKKEREPREKKEKVQAKPGVVIKAYLVQAHPLHVDVRLAAPGAPRGRIHASELPAGTTIASLAALLPAGGHGAAESDKEKEKEREREKGPEMEVVVLGAASAAEARSKDLFECSALPEAIAQGRAGTVPRPSVQLSALKPGSKARGWVQETSGDFVWVSLGPSLRGRAHILDTGRSLEEVRRVARGLEKGHEVSCRVLSVESGGKQSQINLALGDAEKGAEPSASNADRALKPGALVSGKVTRVSAGQGLQIALGPRLSARAALIDLSDIFVDNPTAPFREGALVRCRVLSVEGGEGSRKVDVSLRASQGGAYEGQPAKQRAMEANPAVPDSLAVSSLEPGSVLGGYVKSATPKGVFVTVSRGLVGRIQLSQLSDMPLPEPLTHFPEGKFVKAKVLSAAEGRLDLSLRTAVQGGKGWRTLEQLREGELVTGRVRKAETFGVFVTVDGTSVSGLAHISECADNFVKDLAAEFKPGQAVRAKILKIDKSAGRLSLGLKPSYFEGAEAAAAGAAEGSDDEDIEEAMARADGSKGAAGSDSGDDSDAMDVDGAAGSDSESDSDAEEDGDGEGPSGSDGEQGEGRGAAVLDFEAAALAQEDSGSDAMSDSGSEDGMDSGAGSDSESDGGVGMESGSEGEEEEEAGAARGAAPGGATAERSKLARALMSTGRADLESEAGPLGGGLVLEEEEGELGAAGRGNGAEPSDAGPKLSKAAKKRQKEDHERAVRDAERAKLDGDRAPQTPQDFDRLLLTSPSSSYLWIRYMAHLLQLGEAAAARGVAEKAIQTIHFREESEKFNVWVAYLNLEAMYGEPDPEAALARLFQRALQYTDAKKLYLAMAGICERTDRKDLAAQTLKGACKKFSGSCKVWLRHVTHLLAQGDQEGVKAVSDRALQALPRRKHVKFLSQVALSEFRVGSAERGRGLFESVLRNFPARLDLWSVYLDQEIRQGEAARVRALFERATSLTLAPRKMKFLFKRYLEYERENGDDASVDKVKRKAMEYVQSTVHVGGKHGGGGDSDDE